jgi:hypothetical protein
MDENSTIQSFENDEVKQAFEAAAEGTLPPDFQHWDWKDDDGRTIAHAAAEHGYLPAGFDNWDWQDEYGQTVAHAAAEHGHLPLDFESVD